MMKQIFYFLFLVSIAFVSARPSDQPNPNANSKILKSAFDLDPAGSYSFGFETDNAISRDETGEIKLIKNEEGKDEEVVVVRGSFSYTDAEGNPYTVTYYADETGFHPEGAHLPNVPGVGHEETPKRN